MRKKLIGIIIVVGMSAQMTAEIKQYHCYYTKAGTETASGIAHAFRVNVMDSKNKEPIKNAALIALVTNGLSAAIKIFVQYKNKTFAIDFLKDIAEGFNAYRMYTNAKALAKRNKNLTLEQKKELKKAKAILSAILVIERPITAYDNYQKATTLQRSEASVSIMIGKLLENYNDIVSNDSYFLPNMIFPIYEHYFNETFEKNIDEKENG